MVAIAAAAGIVVLASAARPVAHEDTARTGVATASPAASRASGAPARIVYGGDRAFPPYEYLDADGQPAGFNVELIREVAREAGVEVDIRLGVWRERVHALDAGEVDVMMLAHSGARADRYDWLDRTWTLHQVMVFSPGRHTYPASIRELKHEIVAVEDRSLVHELLTELAEAERPTLVLTRSQGEALRLLVVGQTTAVLGNSLTLQVAANELGARTVVVESVASLSYHLATRRGHGPAMAWLVPALARVRESGRFDRLVEQHLVVAPRDRTWWDDYRQYVWLALVTGLGTCVAFLVWFRSLERQVRAREAAVARTTRLLALTESLAEALTPDAVARVLVEQGREASGAFGGFVALVEGTGPWVEVVAASGYPSGVVERWRRVPLDAPLPGADVIRSGEAVFVESADALAAKYPAVAFDVEGTIGPATHAFAAVALRLGAQRLGSLGLSFASPRTFNSDDRAVLRGLAKQGAQALERARLYDAERRARAEAEAASRAKDDFLATLSHELRTPLNAILGWSHMLRQGVVEPAKASRALETIERNARMQTQLIADLLDVSRAARGALELDEGPVDLGHCLESAVDAVRPSAAAKGIELTTRVGPATGDVRGDDGRVQQILWNLLSNAIKFTPSGGHVDVSLEYDATLATIRVRDSGVGIEPAQLPFVFERFYQVDPSPTRRFGGLGLGLAIARHLADLHGGSVTASSEGSGYGSEFVLRLPVRGAEDAERRRVPAVARKSAQGFVH